MGFNADVVATFSSGYVMKWPYDGRITAKDGRCVRYIYDINEGQIQHSLSRVHVCGGTHGLNESINT